MSEAFPEQQEEEVDVNDVLEGAKGFGYDRVIVTGWNKDGELVTSSSFGSAADLFWLLERTKVNLHRIMDEDTTLTARPHEDISVKH